MAPSLAKAAILRGIHLAVMLASYLTSHERKSLLRDAVSVQLLLWKGREENNFLIGGCTRHNVPGHVADYDLE